MNELTEKSKRKVKPSNRLRWILVGAGAVVLLLMGAWFLLTTMMVCGCQPPPEYLETAAAIELTNDQKRAHLTQTAIILTSDPIDMGQHLEATQNSAVTATASAPMTATAAPGS